MAVVFEMYDRATVELTDLGTVKSLIPEGTIRYVQGTVERFRNGSIKALNSVLTKADGSSTLMVLTKNLSADIVKAFDNGVSEEDTLAVLLDLQIVENEDGWQGISRPRSENGGEVPVSFKVKELSEKKRSYQDLVAF